MYEPRPCDLVPREIDRLDIPGEECAGTGAKMAFGDKHAIRQECLVCEAQRLAGLARSIQLSLAEECCLGAFQVVVRGAERKGRGEADDSDVKRALVLEPDPIGLEEEELECSPSAHFFGRRVQDIAVGATTMQALAIKVGRTRVHSPARSAVGCSEKRSDALHPPLRVDSSGEGSATCIAKPKVPGR